MIPEKGKFYEIDYKDEENDEMSYKGIGLYTGEQLSSLEMFYVFDIPDNILQAWFTDNDIIRESDQVFKPIQFLKNNP